MSWAAHWGLGSVSAARGIMAEGGMRGPLASTPPPLASRSGGHSRQGAF